MPKAMVHAAAVVNVSRCPTVSERRLSLLIGFQRIDRPGSPLNGLQLGHLLPISQPVTQGSTVHAISAGPDQRWLRRAIVGCLCALSVVATASQGILHAQAADPRQVKAEFVVSFLSFVDWPAAKTTASSGQLVVAVLGDPEFANLVRQAASRRQMAGRPVSVMTVQRPEAAREAHVAFIASSEAKRLPAILRTLATAPVLTVGDTDGFAQEGVAINLYTFDKRIRIEVNTTAAERAGVRLSSNLLRLARIVQ